MVLSFVEAVECSFFECSCCDGFRLVWNRIWAVLSDFFVEVGCHRNLQVLQCSVCLPRDLIHS